jgi:hypothetical protein
MSDTERPPIRGFARAVSLAAITLAVFAGTIFIVVIVLGSGGDTNLARVFGPIGIASTVLGLAAAIYAITQERTRVVGITVLLVLLPSCVLSLLTIVAANS